jgi:hypothetical protein
MLNILRSKRRLAGWIGVWGCLVLLPLCQQLFVMLPTSFVYDNNTSAPSASTFSSSRRNQQVEKNHPSLSHPDLRPDGVSIATPFLRKQQAETTPSQETEEIVSIAVATTITGCSRKFPMDGAAILQYSLLNATSSASRYRYHFYAIYHPDATECVQSLAALGYTLLERQEPVRVSEIQNEHYRTVLPTSGASNLDRVLIVRSPRTVYGLRLTVVV